MMLIQKNTALQKLCTMNRRVPYNPFEELDEFLDLRNLSDHILDALKVKTVKVMMNLDFDQKLINDPKAILPVPRLLVGNATFEYIWHSAEKVLKNVENRIQLINDDKSLSFADKFQLFEEVKNNI